MLLVGIDDTDLPGTPGTNQLARRIVGRLPGSLQCDVVLRHQLLLDPRIPYTSQNGAASIGIRPGAGAVGPGSHAASTTTLLDMVRQATLEFAPPGSDPGLCVATLAGPPPPELLAFGARCKTEPVEQSEARALASHLGLHLEGLGGTRQGVVGALAAVALRESGNDGRAVHAHGWPWPDPFGGVRAPHEILARGVDAIRERSTGASVDEPVDLGKRLRPSFHDESIVLWVERQGSGPAPWAALKLP